MNPQVEIRLAVVRNQKLTDPATRADADRFEGMESRAAIVVILPFGFVGDPKLVQDAVRAAVESNVRSLEYDPPERPRGGAEDRTRGGSF